MLFLASSASCPTWKAQNVSLEWLFNKFHKDPKLPKTTLWMVRWSCPQQAPGTNMQLPQARESKFENKASLGEQLPMCIPTVRDSHL